jgi:Toxin co-regulated pilus biosynthesis protein Q
MIKPDLPVIVTGSGKRRGKLLSRQNHGRIRGAQAAVSTRVKHRLRDWVSRLARHLPTSPNRLSLFKFARADRAVSAPKEKHPLSAIVQRENGPSHVLDGFNMKLRRLQRAERITKPFKGSKKIEREGGERTEIVFKLLVLGCLAGVAGCSGGESLAEPSGPVFALNTGPWQLPPATINADQPGRASVPSQVARLPQKATPGKPVDLLAGLDGRPKAGLAKAPLKTIAVASVLSPKSITKPLAARVAAAPEPYVKPYVPPPPLPVWTLQTDTWIGKDVVAWGNSVGWTVLWHAGSDWQVPATTTYSGTFRTAAGNVLNDMIKQGAPIEAVFHEGNRTLVVTNGEQP